METKANTHNTDNCANIEIAKDIIIGKWKPVILLHLFNNEKLRFSELQRAIPDISKKMLTNQLRELERHDIVHRKVYAEVPPRVEYSVTVYGNSLKTVLLSMHTWGLEHLHHLNELDNDK